jgi:rhomboid protease GluP
MAEPADGFIEVILRECAAASPQPWYPVDYVRKSGAARERLDPDLDRLRMAGLIHLTDWTQGKGQGYALTEEGRRAAGNPRILSLIKSNRWTPSGPERNAPQDPYHLDPTPMSRGERVHAALDNAPPYPSVTYALIAANVTMFLAGLLVAVRMGISPGSYLTGQDNTVQHTIGALRPTDLAQGEWYQWLRLLSNCFVHFGIIHILANMYSLYVIGPLLERIWGRARFLILYLLSGWAGSCAMVIFMALRDPRTQGAGASGAIWGILASLPVWIAINRKYLSSYWASSMMRQLLWVFVINIGISLLPQVSASAHFGGGAAGALAAFLLNEQRFGSGIGRVLSGLGLLFMPVLCLAILLEARGTGTQWQAPNGAIATSDDQLKHAVSEAQALYFDEIEPLLRLGPGFLNKAGRDELIDKIDDRLQRLKESDDFLDQVSNQWFANQEGIRNARQLIENLRRLLELSKHCISAGKDCSADDLDAIRKQEAAFRTRQP